MKTKQRFLSALLMAIIMMAMSPMKMWAQDEPLTLIVGPNTLNIYAWEDHDTGDIRYNFNFTPTTDGKYTFSFSHAGCPINVNSVLYDYNGYERVGGTTFKQPATSFTVDALTAGDYYLYVDGYETNYENATITITKEGDSGESETTTISTLPWSNNFDTSTDLDVALLGWDMLNLNNAESWLPYLYITTEAPFYSYSGGSLFFQSKENTNSYLILPAISADLSNAEMSFYYNTYGTSETYSTMSVGYLTDINDQSTYTVIKTMDRTDQFTQATVSLATVPSGARIAICHHGLGDSHYLAVDEISIAPAPAALNVGENKDLDILGSITYTFTPTETGYYNFAFSEYGQFESFCIDVTDAAGQHYGYIDIASGMSTFTPLTAEQTYRVRVQAVTTSESGCQGVTLTVTKCDAPTMTAMEGTSAEGTVEADNQIYRSFSLENAASLTIATDADWALLKKNANDVYECVAISIATGTSNTQSLAAGDYAVALSGTDWEEQAYTLTITADSGGGEGGEGGETPTYTALSIGPNTVHIYDYYSEDTEYEDYLYTFTPEEPGIYTFTFSNNGSEISVFAGFDEGANEDGAIWCSSLTTGQLEAETPYLLYVDGDENDYTNATINITRVADENGNPIYTREMAYEWGTLCLPYPIKYNANNGNYKLYTLSDVATDALTFTEIANGTTIDAGTPLAVKAVGKENAAGKYTISVVGQKVKEQAVAYPKTIKVGDYVFTGTYEEMTDQTDVYFIAQNKFWYADNAITIPANRAYIHAVGEAMTKILNIVVDENGETTSIGSISNGTLYMVNGTYYNLHGQRLAAPQKGQINIINGRKVFVK